MLAKINRFYTSLVFGKPILVLVLLLFVAAVFASQVPNFRLDASADSLLLEGDKDLEYSREINNRFGVRDSVIVAYTPLEGELFSRATIARMAQLRDDLMRVERVQSVDSILNVPVFLDTPLTGISEDYLTVMDPALDLDAAREELVASPVFSNAVVSPDGETAGMLVSFAPDERLKSLLNRRTELRNEEVAGTLTPEGVRGLRQVEADYSAYTVETGIRQTETIAGSRGILDR